MIVKSYNDYTDSASRYRRLKRIESDDGTVRIETANKLSFEESTEDSFFTVTIKEENRLDLVSYQMYGTPLYWWVIAEASGIKDPMTVPVGTVLRVPSPTSLFSTKGVLGNA